MQKAAEAGIAATGNGSLAGQRLTQMRDFYTFLLGRSLRCWTAGITLGYVCYLTGQRWRASR